MGAIEHRKIDYLKFYNRGGETEFKPQKQDITKNVITTRLSLKPCIYFFFSFENKPLDTWYDAIQNVHTQKKNCNSVHNILSCSCKNEGLIH